MQRSEKNKAADAKRSAAAKAQKNRRNSETLKNPQRYSVEREAGRIVNRNQKDKTS